MTDRMEAVIDRARVSLLCCQAQQSRKGLKVRGDREILELTLIKRILPYQDGKGLEQIDCHLSTAHGLY